MNLTISTKNKIEVYNLSLSTIVQSYEINKLSRTFNNNHNGKELMFFNGSKLTCWNIDDNDKESFDISMFNNKIDATFTISSKIVLNDGRNLYYHDRQVDKCFKTYCYIEKLPTRICLNEIKSSYTDDMIYAADYRYNYLYYMGNDSWKRWEIKNKTNTFMIDPNHKSKLIFGLEEGGFLKFNINTIKSSSIKLCNNPPKFLEILPMTNNCFIYADTKDRIFLMNSHENKIEREFDVSNENGTLTSISCSNKEIACGYSDGLVRIYDCRHITREMLQLPHPTAVSFVGFNMSTLENMYKPIIPEFSDDSVMCSSKSSAGAHYLLDLTDTTELSIFENKENIGIMSKNMSSSKSINYSRAPSKNKNVTFQIYNHSSSKNNCASTQNNNLSISTQGSSDSSKGTNYSLQNNNNPTQSNCDSIFTSISKVNSSDEKQLTNDATQFNNINMDQKIIIDMLKTLNYEIKDIRSSVNNLENKITKEFELLKAHVTLEHASTVSDVYTDFVKQIIITENNIKSCFNNKYKD